MSKLLESGLYRHFKGRNYRVVDTAIHSETLEDLVVYCADYGDDRRLWVRPLKMFTGLIKNAEGQWVKRFERIGD